jgi:hypothetical protein
MNKVGDKSYPQYSYSIVACLGQDFDKLVAEKLVSSMSFGFNFAPQTSTPSSTSTSTSTPVDPVEEVEDEEVEDEEVEE